MRRANSYDHTCQLGRSSGGGSSSESPGYSSGGNHLAAIAARVIDEFSGEDDNPYDDIFYYSTRPQNRAATPVDRPAPDEIDEGGRRINPAVETTTTATTIHQHQSPDDAESGEEETQQDRCQTRTDSTRNVTGEKPDDSDEEESETEFEFQFAVPDAENGSSPISADEIFQNGQIRPLINAADYVYARYDDEDDESRNTRPRSRTSDAPPPPPPIRLTLKNLLIEDRDPAAAASDELDGVPPDTYCVWTAGAANEYQRDEKSSSTGSSSSSSSKRWRLRHLLHRSHSDGSRDAFFERGKESRRNSTSSLSKADQQEKSKAKSKSKEKEKKPPGSSNTNSGGGGGGGGGGYAEKKRRDADRRKKSYLPYRQDLLGFFSGANGLSRTIQPL